MTIERIVKRDSELITCFVLELLWMRTRFIEMYKNPSVLKHHISMGILCYT